MIRRLATYASPLLFCLFAGCDETDAVAVRIHLAEDFSGTVTASALALPKDQSAIEVQSQGAQWQSQAEIVATAGHFERLQDLKLADISFSAGEAEEGLSFVRVRLPRGESVRWPLALVPLSPDQRQQASAALDPSGRTKNIGATIKFEIELPNTVIANGLSGKTRGTKVKGEASVATLIVPLETALSEGDPIVWHLTWQK